MSQAASERKALEMSRVTFMNLGTPVESYHLQFLWMEFKLVAFLCSKAIKTPEGYAIQDIDPPHPPLIEFSAGSGSGSISCETLRLPAGAIK